MWRACYDRHTCWSLFIYLQEGATSAHLSLFWWAILDQFSPLWKSCNHPKSAWGFMNRPWSWVYNHIRDRSCTFRVRCSWCSCLLVGTLRGWGAFMRALLMPSMLKWIVTLEWSRSEMPPKKKTETAINTRHGSISHGQDVLKDTDADDAIMEPPSSVSPELLAAIKWAVKDTVGTQLANIDKALTQLVQINERIESLEHSMQATSDRLEDAITTMLPAITAHMSRLAEALARRQLELEVHRRKWNLVIHGIEGKAKEDGALTRQACVNFAKTVLKVPDAEATVFAACHRLSQKANAGIIVRFVDLAQRDSWLSGTKHLKNHSRKVSISPDLLPVIRPLKDELMEMRSKLPRYTKQKSKLRFLPHWPFVELRTDGQSPKRPSFSLSAVTSKMLDIEPLLQWR